MFIITTLKGGLHPPYFLLSPSGSRLRADQNLMKNKRGGETILELLMTYVAPVIGASVTTVIVIRTTTLPKWLCLVLGLPVGTILGWIGLLGLAIIFSRITSKFGSRKKDEPRE